ncbi:MAG TPA: PmoA family protein [Bryobacteraceae bacterium]
MKPARLLPVFLLACPLAAQVKLTPSADKVDVSIGGKPYSTFYMTGGDVTKPYLWPVRAATGTSVTRSWPMEIVPEEEKEKKDHPHQRGIWFAHDSVNGIDFWNNEASYKEPPKRGKMVLKAPAEVKGGGKKGTLKAVFDWTDRQGNVQLTETRLMTFYDEKDRRTIDFDITLTSVVKVVWGDGKDGAFGIRMRPVLDEQGGTGTITNADGLVGEKELWGKPSNWCDYSGKIGEEKVGVAIFDHPSNPSHPVRWHARGYGLFAANPFGLAVFTGDKSQNGAITVEPGKSIRFRYRVVVHPGDVKTLDLNALYAKFAAEK